MMIWSTGQSSQVYIGIVRKYLSWVVKYYPNADEKFISELLRYSLCVLLKLESKSSNGVVTEVAEDCIKHLRHDIKRTNILTKSLESRQAFLEACVHCIEFTRKRCSD